MFLEVKHWKKERWGLKPPTTLGPQNHEKWRFYTPNIWVITPKNVGNVGSHGSLWAFTNSFVGECWVIKERTSKMFDGKDVLFFFVCRPIWGALLLTHIDFYVLYVKHYLTSFMWMVSYNKHYYSNQQSNIGNVTQYGTLPFFRWTQKNWC